MSDSLINSLSAMLGNDNVSIESGCLVLGVSKPLVVVLPQNIEQVSEVMRFASRESLAVIPRGSGTKMGLGNNPDRADLILCTEKLDAVVEHAASDLTATAECGITLDKLQDVLKEQNQFLPIDPSHGYKTTLGGIIATNDSGSLRLRYGTARELLIGLRVVRADGSLFKGGSKVVKNVSGYDLPKLYVGSLGTLGIIVEATFRLYPIPEYSRTYLASFVSADKCQETVISIMNSNLVLASLDFFNSSVLKSIAKSTELDLNSNGYSLAVRVMSVERAVKDQISQVKEICSKNGGRGVLLGDKEEERFWLGLRKFEGGSDGSGRALCKAGVLIEDVAKVFNSVERLHEVKTYAGAKAGNGIVNILIEGEDETLLESVTHLRNFCDSVGGYLVVQRAPEEIKTKIDVWGNIGSGTALMKRLKSNLDPMNLLNPGRFI